jgi:SAM-dependent methyltransferase
LDVTSKPEKVVDPDLLRLAGLIERNLHDRSWSPDDAETEAKKLKLGTGLSARNIREYLNTGRNLDTGRKRPPTKAIIRRFALLFGQSEDEWVAQFPRFGVSPALLDRTTVIAAQSQLLDGDQVLLISCRPFLEASDIHVADEVLRNLDRGLQYVYFYPHGSSNPYGDEAETSYRQFRDTSVAHYRFSRSPRVFGYTVDPSRFKYFSALHTIVHYASRVPGLTKTYVYIEYTRDNAGQKEHAWYVIPDQTWREIEANLRTTRSQIPNLGLPLQALNPRIATVSLNYVKWFKQPAKVSEYAALRPVLGHSGDRCIRALKTEFARMKRPRASRYLDIGCGDGAVTRSVADFIAEHSKVVVTGLDVSRSQLDAAKRQFRGGRIEFEAVDASFEDFRAPRGYNFITAIHSLYAIDEAYLRRVYELLQPGGIACVWMAMGKDNVVTAISDAVDEVLRPGQRRNAAEDVASYAMAAGLDPSVSEHVGTIQGLLDEKGKLTKDGRKLVQFCALEPLKPDNPAWAAATRAINGPTLLPEGRHSLKDALIVLSRPPDPASEPNHSAAG